MANELITPATTSGLTVTATTYLSGVVSTAGIPCPEVGSTGVYRGNMTGLAGIYNVLFISAGFVIASGWIAWDGTAEVSASPVTLTSPLPTALSIITSALKIAGVLGQNETPTSSEADDGLIALNDMLDSWSIDRTNIFTISQYQIPVTSGVSSYTIGSGGTLNIVPPRKIDNAFIRINSVDYPLKEINNQDYNSIAYKGNGSFPFYFYYDTGFPNGTLTIYGVPTQGTIFIEVWSQLTNFANLTTQYTFPLGYYRALRYNLAKEIAPLYRVTLTPEAQIIATESFAAIKQRNLPAPVMKNELGLMVGTGQMYRSGP